VPFATLAAASARLLKGPTAFEVFERVPLPLLARVGSTNHTIGVAVVILIVPGLLVLRGQRISVVADRIVQAPKQPCCRLADRNQNVPVLALVIVIVHVDVAPAGNNRGATRGHARERERISKATVSVIHIRNIAGAVGPPD